MTDIAIIFKTEQDYFIEFPVERELILVNDNNVYYRLLKNINDEEIELLSEFLKDKPDIILKIIDENFDLY